MQGVQKYGASGSRGWEESVLVLARLTKAVPPPEPAAAVADVALVVQVERVRIRASRCFSRPPALSRRWGLLSMKGVCIVASVGGMWWIDVNEVETRDVCFVFGFGVAYLTLTHTHLAA